MRKSNSASGLTAKRSNRLFIAGLTALAVLLALPTFAVDYASTGATTEQTVQMRLGASFTKKWKCGVRLSLDEELRFNLMDNLSGTTAKNLSADTAYGASFYKSYTTLSLAYAPIPYFKMDAGYTLRLLGNKGWSDPNEFLRHRVFFSVTGTWKNERVKLYLRERALCDMRTDSVNLLEKNRYNWLLRSRIGFEYTVMSRPVKPYLWVELENTLNAPEYQQKDGRQYISQVRTQAGVRWRLTKLSSLDFFYRFQYGYDRDINVTKKKSYVELTEEKSFVHAIGIAYSLDW